MKKEIGFYRDDTTPYKYSYSPYTQMWYEDEYEQMPEPDIQAEKLTNFKLYDELGDRIWGNSEWAFKEEEEEEKAEFERYIKFVCGEENTWRSIDKYTITIIPNSQKQERAICITVDELVDLEEFIKNVTMKNYSFVYCEDFSGVKFFVWKKENNKIRLLIQNYGSWEIGYINYDDLLVIEYDMEIDKDEFINEFMRVINKYKNLILEKIEEYEKKNNIKFSNPQNIAYIDYWIKNKK